LENFCELLCFPWCKFLNKNKQYAAQKNLDITDRINKILEILIVVVTIFISLNRFKEGGEAMLNINNKNSQNLILGNVKESPLFIYRLRLLNRK